MQLVEVGRASWRNVYSLQTCEKRRNLVKKPRRGQALVLTPIILAT